MPSVIFLQTLGLTYDDAKQRLREVGCTHGVIWPDAELDASQKADVEIVVAKQHNVGPEQLEQFPNLRLVSLAFTGHDELKKQYCRERGLHVFYVPDYSTVAVAELTIWAAIDLSRKCSGAAERMRAGNWDEAEEHAVTYAYPRELMGQVVGIVGTGSIGMEAARRFHAFGSRLIGWTKNPDRHPEFEQLGGRFVPRIEDVFEQADIVSLHLELNDKTEKTANADRLNRMRDHSMLINTARTYLVDPSALVRWLHDNPDKTAALDITKKNQFEKEFQGVDNLILLPHLGCQAKLASEKLARVTIDNIGRFLNPRPDNQLIP